MPAQNQPELLSAASPDGAAAQAQEEKVTTPAPLWARLVLPSIPDLLFALVLLVLLFDSRGFWLLNDPDAGWHIRNGEHILVTHAVPHVDYFSTTMQGKPWYAWEWLYDVVLGAVHRVAGLNGVVMLSAAIIGITFALLFRATLRRSNVVIALVLTLLSLGVATIHFLARPHIVSWLFTLICFLVLDEFRHAGNWKRLAWLPVLMLLWVNMHGGFILGVVLPVIFLVSNLWTAWSSSSAATRAGELQSARKLGWATLATLAATFITPYGYELHAHVFKYLGNTYLMDTISEFLSPNFHNLAAKLFIVLVMLWVVGAIQSARKASVLDFLIFGFSVYSSLYAARNLPVAGILLSVTAAPLLQSALISTTSHPDLSSALRRTAIKVQSFSERIGAVQSKLNTHFAVAALTAVLAAVCLHGGYLFSRQIVNAKFSEKELPVQASEYIAAHNIRTGIFTTDSWGAYLIYHLYPNYLVLVDDRHDMYGQAFLEDCLAVIRVRPNWEAMLQKYQATRVLVAPSSALAQTLALAPHWKEEYRDSAAVMFVRVDR